MVIESKGGAAEPASLVLNEEDLAYEEEILRNPHAIKVWKLFNIVNIDTTQFLFSPGFDTLSIRRTHRKTS